jgi:hypothetical protein
LNNGCFILIIIVLILAALLIFFNPGSRVNFFTNHTNQKQYAHSQEHFFETLIERGYVKINYDSCQVFIDSCIWSESDASEKQNMTIAFANYVHKKRNSNESLFFIDIYDKNSNKKLANWSTRAGYKQFEQQ